jgi:hypothetical protein
MKVGDDVSEPAPHAQVPRREGQSWSKPCPKDEEARYLELSQSKSPREARFWAWGLSSETHNGSKLKEADTPSRLERRHFFLGLEMRLC